MIFRRRPDLPDSLHDAWWGFVDCAEVIEGGRRHLLATLPTGRVEPAPIGLGLDALGQAIEDARGWMDRWHVDDFDEQWRACSEALDEAEEAIPEARDVAASTDELEELLEAVEDVVAPLDAFADAERDIRREYRVPSDRATSDSRS